MSDPEEPSEAMGGHRLLYVVNDAPFFLSHRLALAVRARRAGYDVTVASPEDAAAFDLLRSEGLTAVAIPLDRGGMNPLKDARVLRHLWRLMARIRPDVVHLVTSKAIIYGGIAARLQGIPALGAFSGMGYVFSNRSAKTRALKALTMTLYRLACRHPRFLGLFQNEDDRRAAVDAGVMRMERTRIAPGSGTDLKVIRATPLPRGRPVVLLPARMLRQKGVAEFAAAAEILRSRGVDALFRLQGDPDPRNPSSFTEEELIALARAPNVEWNPHTSDIAAALSRAHVVALPSHGGEGLPKTLIDAAAAGRPAVATDVPGCRDAIVPGKTGVLCRPRDAADLADRIAALLADGPRLDAMARAARQHAEAHFDVGRIADMHMDLYGELAVAAPRRGRAGP